MGCLKKLIIKVGIILALGASLIISWEAFKHFCFDEGTTYEQQLKNSNINQKMIEQYLDSKEIAADRFMENLDTTQEIVLAEETGISNITLTKGDNDFWSFLIESKVDISVEYRAIISIDPSKITFINAGDHIVASYSDSDIHIKSVEILNENIIVNRKIFGLDFSDDTKVMLRKTLIQDVKEQIMEDEMVVKNSKTSLESFFQEMATQFGTKINFISDGDSYALNEVNYDGIYKYKIENTEYNPASYYQYYEYEADGIHPYNWNSNQATTMMVGGVCSRHTSGNTSPYMDVSKNGWNSHYTQTHYSVVEEGGNIVGAGVKWNDAHVKVIDNEMNYRDPQYGYLPIYAVNINQVKEYGKVYGSELYGSIIEIEYPDGTVRKGIVLDACGQCAKEAKIDLWVYHDDNDKHVEDVQFKFVRFGWGNSYNENIFKSRMQQA